MPSLEHRRLRAPIADGTALIDPPLDQVAQLIASNRARSRQFQANSGFTAEMHGQARAGLIELPRIFVEPATKPDTSRTIVATGHQPELFHPGVWFKNFVAHAIARRVNAMAVNIVVDNDLARSSGIRVPTRIQGATYVQEARFDAPASKTTWEKRNIVDVGAFRSFADQVRNLFAPLMPSRDYQGGMLLDQFWRHAITAFDRQQQDFSEFAHELAKLADDMNPDAIPPFGILGLCLSEARSRIESDLGLKIDNRALSELTDQRPFLEFIQLLLHRHRELHSVHNEALAEFRTVNHIRSRTHPVPELAADADWFEVPLWISTFENPHRRRAFVRKSGNCVELSDRSQTHVCLPAGDSSTYRQILVGQRIELRPRALITTMYARLVLSDLFIHGIGGAKYDELTDLIIRRFFGIEPPAYVTATATFRLPIDRPSVSLDDVRASARHIRDLRHSPESFLRDARVAQDADLAPKLASLAAEKREFLDKHDLRHCSQDVFDRLNLLNLAMNDLLTPLERQLRAEHTELIALAKQSQLLGSREFSFVLFPTVILPARLLDLSKNVS